MRIAVLDAFRRAEDGLRTLDTLGDGVGASSGPSLRLRRSMRDSHVGLEFDGTRASFRRFEVCREGAIVAGLTVPNTHSSASSLGETSCLLAVSIVRNGVGAPRLHSLLIVPRMCRALLRCIKHLFSLNELTHCLHLTSVPDEAVFQ